MDFTFNFTPLLPQKWISCLLIYLSGTDDLYAHIFVCSANAIRSAQIPLSFTVFSFYFFPSIILG
jgi:hypothetical protein